MKKLYLLILSIFCFGFGLNAQNQIVPIDTAIRKGVLPNGLTYYIRHNEKPKQRAEFHIAQNVGAILENDDQNGLAHFLEHIAFNGSEHFADKGIINYFESIGVNFGGNINAYTSLDETVYNLSDVPTYREGIIDSALFVLYDWACAITLADEEIDAERGVILEEWRTSSDANRRMWKASSAQKYAGSQYAKRDVIGDTAVILHFDYQALKDYYKKWYGPDLQAILVVGDIDVAQIEQKIIDLFGKIPPRANRGERPIYYLSDNKEPIVSIVTDKEAQNSRITLEIKHKTPSDDFKLSYNGYVNGLENNLISMIFSYRLDELSQNPSTSFVGAYVGYGDITKSSDALQAITIPKEGKEAQALTDLLAELEKADRFGFTNSELERAKIEMLNSFEKSFNERNNRQNISLTREYIRNYLEAEPIPGIEWEFEVCKNALAQITKEKLNDLLKSYITDENRIIAIQAPEKEAVKVPTKEEILATFSDVKNQKFDAPKEEIIAKNLVDKAPKAGKIKKITKNENFGTTEWLLSNGVKVVIKPTEFKKDEIVFNAASWGGTNTLAPKDLPSAEIAADLIEYSGLGNYSNIDLQKILSGKTLSVSPMIFPATEILDGNSSVKDFEFLLQSIYLYFTSVREDEDAYKTMIEQYRTALANREQKAKNIFNDSVKMTWSCRDERKIIVNLDMLEKVNRQRAMEIFKERFSAANDFVFTFVGNINPEDKNTQKLISTWLGGLPKGKTEQYIKIDECHPKGFVQNHFTRKMEVENATNVIRYYADMPYNFANRLNMAVLGKILDIRYLESVREKEGGSYGVGVGGYVDNLPKNEALLYVQFDCNPEKQPRLLEIIHEEIAKISNEGVRTDDLQKVKESMLKDFDENLEKNDWWKFHLYKFYFSGDDFVTNYRAEVEKITPETVAQTLKTLLSSGNITEIVMMPEK
ncbi:MAG: insulinase family protein [Prevotellaceae bacterium]|nr:insulinase family protein [Prevotellaceae bacterium]